MRQAVERAGLLSKTNRLIAKFALLIIYLAVLSYGLFFAESLGRSVEHGSYNIIPFHEIRRYIHYADALGWETVAVNLLGNVAAFLPFGFLITSFFPENDKAHPVSVAGLSLLFSVTIELLQHFTSVGAADIDDVILNTAGGFLGYLLYIAWRFAAYGSVNRLTEEGAT